MTPAERAAMCAAQRESWVRGEMALGAEERKTTRICVNPRHGDGYHSGFDGDCTDSTQPEIGPAEIDDLRAENARLCADVKSAEARIAQLEAEVEVLRGLSDTLRSDRDAFRAEADAHPEHSACEGFSLLHDNEWFMVILPTPEQVARYVEDAMLVTDTDRDAVHPVLVAAIRADRLRVLDACREEVRLAVHNNAWHISAGYCLGKLMMRLVELRREIEQPAANGGGE